MAEALIENTIDSATLGVACWLADNTRVIRDFKMAATGHDRVGRLFVQIRLVLPDPINPMKNAPTFFNEELPVNNHFSKKDMQRAIERYAESRDVPEDPNKFLTAPYALVNSDLSVTPDVTRTSLWRLYEPVAFGWIWVIDKPLTVWNGGKYNG